jgi:hypothetical protein
MLPLSGLYFLRRRFIQIPSMNGPALLLGYYSPIA